MSRSKNKLVMLTGGNREAMEGYRSLRARLDQRCRDGSRIVAAASPHDGNGTAELVSNLAVAYAQAGRRTLLVDGDMLKPVVHALFGLPNALGLSSVLEVTCEPDDAVHRDVLPNLSIMTAGLRTTNQGDLFGSFPLKQLFEHWRRDFDIVWFRSPPLLVSSDAQLLVGACDGTLLVLRSGGTEEREAYRVKRLLSLMDVQALGVALTHKQRKRWLIL